MKRTAALLLFVTLACTSVLRVDRGGRATDFLKEAQDGVLGGLGVKVDARRGLLWVISTTTPEMRGWKAGDDRFARLPPFTADRRDE